MAERITLAQRLLQARQARQARNIGVPSIVSIFSQMMSSYNNSLVPILLIATGDVLSDEHRAEISPYVTWLARPLIAEVIAHRWGNMHGVRDPDQLRARAYGEMAGMSSARTHSSLADRDSCRTKVTRALREVAPNINEIRSLIGEIIRRCRVAGPTVAPLDECQEYIPGGVQVNNQKLAFYMLRGQLIPADWLVNQEAIDVWRNLADLRTGHFEIEVDDYELAPEFAQLWSRARDETILGYYEGKALQSPEKPRGLISGALFCYLATLAKDTQVWYQPRIRQFQKRIPGVDLEAYISDTIVKQFARMYVQTDAVWEDVYRQLAVCRSQLQMPEGLSLTWIIEQTSGNNVTCLTTISDVVTKLHFFDLELLLSKGLPVGDVTSALTQARDLLRNPFCSVVRPTVNVRQYADLAYLCTYIKRDLMRDRAFLGFRGEARAMCTLSDTELKQLGSIMYELSQDRNRYRC